MCACVRERVRETAIERGKETNSSTPRKKAARNGNPSTISERVNGSETETVPQFHLGLFRRSLEQTDDSSMHPSMHLSIEWTASREQGLWVQMQRTVYHLCGCSARIHGLGIFHGRNTVCHGTARRSAARHGSPFKKFPHRENASLFWWSTKTWGLP